VPPASSRNHTWSEPAGRADPPHPLVFAHRGSSAALPEHTLDAYQRAIDEGADGLECDIRMTRDGHLVCIHDRRLDRTSNGRGRVSAATLDQLSELDFGSWHPPPPNERDLTAQDSELAGGPSRFGVLTLDRLLGAAVHAGRPLQLLIETKHPTRYGAAVEQRLVDVLRRHGLTAVKPAATVQVTLMSFSALAIRRFRALAPTLSTVFLFEVVAPGIRDGRPPFGARILGPSVAAVRANRGLVRRAHERGHRVYVWTVNTPDEVDLVLGLGVDGIITDDPAYVLTRLGR
jgi:glycerophosphoryl diester phosphodiesterase